MVGRKSDYYSEMSPITLAPKIHNPWTNPMKRAIVSPVYSPTETFSLGFGPDVTDDLGYPRAGVTIKPSTDLGDISAVATGHNYLVLNQWNVTPGVRTITGIRYWRRDSTSVTFTSTAYVEVWRDDGATMTLIGSESAGSAGYDDWTRVLHTLATGFSVTIETGKTYYYGLRFVKETDHDTPWLSVNAVDMTLNQKRFYFKPGQFNGTTIADADVAGELNVVNSQRIVRMDLYYTSNQYLEQNITADTIGRYVVPYYLTQPYFLRMFHAHVHDSEALTAVLENIDGNGAVVVINTMELDMGDTTPGQNDIIFDGNTVNLPDIGASGQEGASQQLLFAFYPGTGKTDLFFRSQTLESSIHSHACANGSARALKYTSAVPRLLATSGTATVESIQVGCKPAVLVGDSQTYGTDGALSTGRWKVFMDSLAKPRMFISVGTQGQMVADTNTLVFNHVTPGAGDGVELAGADCLLVLSGIGINDIKYPIHYNMRDAASVAAAVCEDVIQILRPFVNADDDIMLGGLPPLSYAVGGVADKYNAHCVRDFNRALLGLALSWRVPFYNPWPDMVTPGTEHNDIPEFYGPYTYDVGLHYDSAGGAVFGPKAVYNYEHGLIDLRDAWD